MIVHSSQALAPQNIGIEQQLRNGSPSTFIDSRGPIKENGESKVGRIILVSQLSMGRSNA